MLAGSGCFLYRKYHISVSILRYLISRAMVKEYVFTKYQKIESMSILFVLLYYSFAKWHHWRKLDDELRDLSVLYFTTLCKSTTNVNVNWKCEFSPHMRFTYSTFHYSVLDNMLTR